LRANLGGVAGNGRSKPESISSARNPKQKSLAIGGIHGDIHSTFQQEEYAGWFLRLAD
jgi:hypothetical protein